MTNKLLQSEDKRGSLDRRTYQAEKIRDWKPWEHSTGANSAEGKAIVSRNALKHGYYSASMRELKRALRKQARLLKDLGLENN
ncbi:MAG: hypothetical protein KA508_06610 [Gammaproteobacteria bacterium]|nr:hypothetical protein [Gammaproteobacteria bacterium]